MSDIVRRLRGPAYWMSGSDEGHEGENDAPYDAADEITALRAENERLRAALEPFGCQCVESDMCKHPHVCRHYLARAALEEGRT